MLASVAEQAGLSLTWSETPEDTFSHEEAQVLLETFFTKWSTLSCREYIEIHEVLCVHKLHIFRKLI